MVISDIIIFYKRDVLDRSRAVCPLMSPSRVLCHLIINKYNTPRWSGFCVFLRLWFLRSLSTAFCYSLGSSVISYLVPTSLLSSLPSDVLIVSEASYTSIHGHPIILYVPLSVPLQAGFALALVRYSETSAFWLRTSWSLQPLVRMDQWTFWLIW